MAVTLEPQGVWRKGKLRLLELVKTRRKNQGTESVGKIRMKDDEEEEGGWMKEEIGRNI